MIMKDLNQIKVILLDFGGVISPEGFRLGVLHLSGIYGKSYDEMHEIAATKALKKSGYLAGKSPENKFWEIIAKELDVNEQIMEYRYLILDNFVPRKEIIDTVIELKEKFKWGIFSDQTNWIHEVDEKYGFFKHFDYKFISYDLGYTKYNDEFYIIPSQEIKLPPENILIIDDKQSVLDRAKEFGYHTFRFDAIQGFLDFIYQIE
jgi:HAD superfamily hydrolase (TIGR01509 family)